MKKSPLLKYALHIAVFAGVVIAATRYINGDDFWRALQRFDWMYAPLILALALSYLLVKGWRFVAMLRELTDTSRWLLLRGYIAAQACTLLPGGIAARAGILEQARVPIADSAAAVAVSSLSDQIVLIAVALISALWFDAARKPVLFLLAGLTALSIVLGIEATRTWLLGVVEKILGRFHLLDKWRDFLQSLRQVTTLPVLLAGIANTVLAFALMVEALDIAVRGVGAAVPYSTLLLAFALPAFLGRISAMPGGIGVTEAGMIGILDAAPGVTLDQAAAAVILFRVGTVLFTALVGGLVYFFGWRTAPEVVS